jgi:hypothetical protein
MKNVEKHINEIVSKVLSEQVALKAEQIMSMASEELHGGQKKLDKNKNGKLDSEDFKMLRKDKKEKPRTPAGFEHGEIVSGYVDEDEPLYRGTKFVDEEEELDEYSFSEGEDFPDLSGDGKITMKDVLLGRGVKLKESLQLTEDELIELIENIVKEQTEVKETNSSLKKSKTENDDYIKSVTKKMKEYLKDGSKKEYNPNPQHFPKGNGELAKMDKMAYVPSEAVDEYEDAFSYPGMTNLVYDEIKPEDEKIDMYLKGNSKTGNAQKDKEGKDLGNAVSSKVGDKFKKNFDENLYGAEQMNASYKRQAQPVDVAGNSTQKGSLKSIRGGKNSTEKSAKIFSQLESVDEKKQNVINEEMEKMKYLLGYKKKTQ